MLHTLSIEDDTPLGTINEEDDSDGPPSPSEAQVARRRAIIGEAAKELAKTNMGYILGNSLATSNSPRITIDTEPIPNPSPSIAEMLKLEPKSEQEVLLLQALRELELKNEVLRQRIVTLQAAQILNDAYCNKLRIQLAMKEKKKGKKNTKLMGDGLPRMLSGDGFYEQVVKFTEWQQQQVEEAGRKADARTAWKEAVKEWEAKNAEIDAAKEELKTEVAAWTKMKNAARAKKTRFSIPKPQRDIEKKAPKPTLKSFIAAAKKSLEQENVHGDDEAELSDGESDSESDEDDEDDD